MKHISTLMAGVFSNILSPLYTDMDDNVMCTHAEQFEIRDPCSAVTAVRPSPL